MPLRALLQELYCGNLVCVSQLVSSDYGRTCTCVASAQLPFASTRHIIDYFVYLVGAVTIAAKGSVGVLLYDCVYNVQGFAHHKLSVLHACFWIGELMYDRAH